MPLSALSLAYWVHEPKPFLFSFSESIGLRYYGLAYILGFVLAAWLLARYAAAGRSHLPREKIGDFMLAIVIGVYLGGRLGYFLFYSPETFWREPLLLFRVWEGGMASHGGFIGVALALLWSARSQKVPFWHLADLVVSAAPIGLLLGRIANFLNGELWGKPSTVPWAVIFTSSAPPGTPIEAIPPRHPSQLYEAALEGALLLALMQWRFWRTDVVRAQPGRLSGEFLVAYAVARIVCELFREPDADIDPIFGLSRGTFYSIFLVGAGLAIIAFSARRRAAAPSGRRPS